MKFEYLYDKDSEVFSFFRIPKILITEPQFDISTDAKLLYGLMLDRASLSVKNGWLDDQSRVYIVYTVAEIMDDLNRGNKFVIKILDELRNIGLIESKRQGFGKPNLIYVKNFSEEIQDDVPERSDKKESKKSKYKENNDHYEEDLREEATPDKPSEYADTSRNVQETFQEVSNGHFKKCSTDTSRSVQETFQEVSNGHFKKCSTDTSRSVQRTFQEVSDGHSNNTDINKTNNNTYKSNTDSDSDSDSDIQNVSTELLVGVEERSEMGMVDQEKKDELINHLENTLRFADLEKEFPNYADIVWVVPTLVSDFVFAAERFRIKDKEFTRDEVIDRFKGLKSGDVEYALQMYKYQVEKGNIKNAKKYLITVMFDKAGSMPFMKFKPQKRTKFHNFEEHQNIDSEALELAIQGKMPMSEAKDIVNKQRMQKL